MSYRPFFSFQIFNKPLKRAAASLMTLSFFLIYAAQWHVFADGEPAVTLTVSEKAVHSGAPFTLSAELSAPASGDLSIAVAGGSDPLSIAIPSGKTSGSLQVKAGEYKKTNTESFSVSAGAGYSSAEADAVSITVLPKPRLTFFAEHYTAAPGQNLTVNMKCLNAEELTLPLDVSLRLADGTVIDHFEFGGEKASYSYKYRLSENCAIPYSFVMFNEAANKKAAEILRLSC